MGRQLSLASLRGAGDRILPPSWRLMAVALGGRGDYGVVGHQPESSVAWSGGDPGCEAYTEGLQAA